MGHPFFSLNKPTMCCEILHSPSLPLLMFSFSLSKTPMACKKGGKAARGGILRPPPLEDFGDCELSCEWSPPLSPGSPSSVCTYDYMGLSARERTYLWGINRAGFNDSEEPEEEFEEEEDNGYDGDDEDGEDDNSKGSNSNDDDGDGKGNDSDRGKHNGGDGGKGNGGDSGDDSNGSSGDGGNDIGNGSNAGGKAPPA